jgi:hypothetical protein
MDYLKIVLVGAACGVILAMAWHHRSDINRPTDCIKYNYSSRCIQR